MTLSSQAESYFRTINSYTNIKQQSVRSSSTASLRSEAGPFSKDWNQHAS
jgi:hypothetical protein